MWTRCWGRRGGRRWGVWVTAVVGVLVLASLKPLRNAILYPVWPSQWRPLGSYRLLERHVVDLFYPMDRSPYTGTCQDVHDTIQRLHILQRAAGVYNDVHVYTRQSWDTYIQEIKKNDDASPPSSLGSGSNSLKMNPKIASVNLNDAASFTRKENSNKLLSPNGVDQMTIPDHRELKLDPETLKKIEFFGPAMTEVEQRTLLRNLFVAVSALEAFNVSYMAAEGTLIGSLRHRGIVPWDDDADLTFRADQWLVAKRVLSCIPGYGLKIYSDFLWKFYSLDSPLWTGEKTTRFPYIDLFPYVEDEDYMWPLIIWLKDKMLWPRRQVFPTRLAPFHGFHVRVPRDVIGVLRHLFGDVSQCESRLFERREKRLTTREERVRIPCKLLAGVYPVYDWQGTEGGGV